MLNHYIDLRTDRAGRGAISTGVLARVFQLVHQVRQRHGLQLACALPGARTGPNPHPGNHLRLFAANRDVLDQVAQELELHVFIQNYVLIGRVKPVPENVSTWIEYRRYRTPGRTSRLHESRQQRIAQGDELPFLHTRSGSTRQAFSIRVEIKRHSSALPGEVQPDSYGLSLFTRPFAVPALPVQ